MKNSTFTECNLVVKKVLNWFLYTFKDCKFFLSNIVKKVSDTLNSNQTILYGLVIFVVLHKVFESIISTIFVEPILNKIESSSANDIITISFFFIGIYHFFSSKQKHKRFSNRRILTILVSFTVLLYYRLTQAVFDFQSMNLFPYIKYIDVLLASLIVLLFSGLFRKKTNLNIDTAKGFHFDNPIKTKVEDKYKRDSIAQTIAERIKNTLDSNVAFAVGISSEWGEGKTSLMNLIENQIKDENRIIIHFNPWINNDEQTLISSFFDEVSSSLRPFNRQLSADLLEYASLLLSVESNYTELIKGTFNKVQGKSRSLQDKFEYINNSIRELGFQVVIIIDDIDRLYEKEVLEVLKLIRNSASFSNTVFIVGYDRNYIISAIRRVIDYRPDAYLEKIFQVEICLPAFEYYVIRERSRQLLIPILNERDVEKLNAILPSTGDIFTRNGFDYRMIGNLRDLNRFVNSFILSYSSLNGECELDDLLCVELLKMKYLSIYNLLVKKYNSFLRHHSNNYYEDTILRLYGRLIKKDERSKEEENQTTTLEEYLLVHHESLGIETIQVKDVMKYVLAIFPMPDIYSTKNQTPLSIRNPICVDRYFHNGLLDSNLSSIEFAKFREKSFDEFKDQISKWVDNGKSNELLNKFTKTDFFKNKTDYEQIIRAIFHLGSIQKPDSKDQFIGLDAKDLMKKTEPKVYEQFYSDKDEFVEFLKTLFENAKSPYISESVFMDGLFRDPIHVDKWSFILPSEYFIEKKQQYFRSYSDSIENINLHYYWLFNYCNYQEWYSVGSNGYKQKEIKSEKAKEIFKVCANKIPGSFLKNIVTRSVFYDKTKYSVSNTASYLWDGWVNFDQFIESLPDGETFEISEFKQFYSKYKEAEYSPIEFPFSSEFLQSALLFSN